MRTLTIKNIEIQVDWYHSHEPTPMELHAVISEMNDVLQRMASDPAIFWNEETVGSLDSEYIHDRIEETGENRS